MISQLAISLDIYLDNGTYTAKQSDAGSRYLLISITDNGTATEIESNAVVNLKARKPSGAVSYDHGTVTDGKALILLTSDTLAEAGMVYCELEITQIDPVALLKTLTFKLDVKSEVYSQTIPESTSTFTALTEALAAAGSIGKVSDLKTEDKSTLVAGVNEIHDEVVDLQNDKEDKSNKVTSIDSESTDTQYPSAKLTYDQLALKEPNLPATPETPAEKYLNGNRSWATPAHNKITDLNTDADYQHITTTQVTKLTNIEENAEVNIIETVSIDGADITPDANRNIDIPLATSTNDGAMSSEYAGKLDGIAENANNYVHPNHTGDVTSDGDGATTIANDAVTNAKLANMTRGTVKVGGTDNAPTDLNAKTDKQILIGNGTDIVSVAVSGDVTISNLGAVTIGANKVTNTKLAQMNTKTIKGNDTEGTANAKDLTVAEAKALLDIDDLEENQGTMADLTTTADTLVGAINELDSEKEDKSNKVTLISGESTDTQYPSAKLTYDQLALKEPNLPVTPETPAEKYLNGNRSWATPAHNKITDLNTDADYQHITTTQVTKLTNIEENAEVNIIETVSIDGADITPDANRNIDIPLATQTNDGVLSLEDKIHIDSIEGNAEVNIVETISIDNVNVAPTDRNINLVLATAENDGMMSSEYASKLDDIAENAEVNILEGIQIDGVDVGITSKKSDIPLATSTNDGAMSSEYAGKLDGIADNANNYTHPASHSPSIITQDANNRFVTDIEKSTWNGKQDALGFTPVPNTRKVNDKALSSDITLTQDDVGDGTTNKVFTSTEKSKLSGIAENANNYVHPNHTGDVTSDGDGATTIANDAVTNAKLANMTRGTIKVGGALDAPTDLNAKTSGNILIGDGTDLKSVAVSGDITITSAGVTAIGANKVTNAKLAQMNTKTIKGNDTAGTANAKDMTVAETKALLDIDDLETAVTELQADVNTLELTNLAYDKTIYGFYWDKTTNTFSRTMSARGAIVNVGVDSEVVYNEFDLSTLFRDIEEVTDALGNVFVRFPKMYFKKTDTATYYSVEVSRVEFKGSYLPQCFWDFTNEIELDYVDIGKHIGSLSDDGTRLESKPGKYPLVNKNIVQMRTLAQANGAGYQQLDIHAVDYLQTLFTIEQATVDSQSKLYGYTNGRYVATDVAIETESDTNRVILPNATAALYEVGQSISMGTSLGGNQIFYGRTIISIEVKDASNKSLIFSGEPVTITAGNIVYNSGYKTGFSSNIASSVGSINSNSSGKHPFVWHGIESLYGDVRQFVDGININERQSWVCKNAANYASNLFAAPYEQLNYVNASTSNYVIAMGYDPAHPYAQLPITVGVIEDSQYKDYYYQSTGQSIALVGGGWHIGSVAGLFFWHLSYSSADAILALGGRLLKKAL